MFSGDYLREFNRLTPDFRKMTVKAVAMRGRVDNVKKSLLTEFDKVSVNANPSVTKTEGTDFVADHNPNPPSRSTSTTETASSSASGNEERYDCPTTSSVRPKLFEKDYQGSASVNMSSTGIEIGRPQLPHLLADHNYCLNPRSHRTSKTETASPGAFDNDEVLDYSIKSSVRFRSPVRLFDGVYQSSLIKNSNGIKIERPQLTSFSPSRNDFTNPPSHSKSTIDTESSDSSDNEEVLDYSTKSTVRPKLFDGDYQGSASVITNSSGIKIGRPQLPHFLADHNYCLKAPSHLTSETERTSSGDSVNGEVLDYSATCSASRKSFDKGNQKSASVNMNSSGIKVERPGILGDHNPPSHSASIIERASSGVSVNGEVLDYSITSSASRKSFDKDNQKSVSVNLNSSGIKVERPDILGDHNPPSPNHPSHSASKTETASSGTSSNEKGLDNDCEESVTEGEAFSPAGKQNCKMAEHKQYPQQVGDIVILGPSETQIDVRSYNSVIWSSPAATTRQLLGFVFTDNVLATHTLTGKPSPAFYGRERPPKMQLDPIKVADITYCVQSKFNCSKRKVRAAITTKCSNTSKKYKRCSQKQTATNT